MRWINTRRLTWLVAHSALIVFAFFYSYPFLWMIASSLKGRSEFFGSGLSLLPKQLLWQNYLDAWHAARFSVYFMNTLFVTLVATGAVIILTSMAGYALANANLFGRRVLVGLMLVTMFLPRGYTIIPIYDIVRSLGLLNTLWAVILVNVGTSMVFNTLLFMSYFSTIPKEIEDSARIDGAGFPRIFLVIALPMAMPMIATVGLFEFLDNWNSFFVPLVFTLGRPELRTLAVGIYGLVGESAAEWTLLCAAATMSLLPSIILFVFLQRAFVNGIAGAIRG